MSTLSRGAAGLLFLVFSTAQLVGASRQVSVQLRTALVLSYCGAGVARCSPSAGEYHAAAFIGLGPSGGARSGTPKSVSIQCNHGFGDGRGRIYLVGSVHALGGTIRGTDAVIGTAADDGSVQRVVLNISATQHFGADSTHATVTTVGRTSIDNGPASRESKERLMSGGIKVSISGAVDELFDFRNGGFHGFKRVQAIYTCDLGLQPHLPGAGDSTTYDFDAELDRRGASGSSP